MAKKILLIDAERAFARDASAALQARGAEARISVDGQQGLDEARAWRPDVVVVCVELPGLSGYSVCNKLKKDELLRSIPLVLTSSEATAETFEQHRKLRTRAEEYLRKPLAPEELVRAIAGLIELGPAPDAGAAIADAELELIDRVFDELASGSPPGRPSGGASGGDLPPVTVVGRAEALAGGRDPATADADWLRARVAELEAELSRLRTELASATAARSRLEEVERALDQATQSERTATERAAAIETRLRQADALREKARRALTVVLQALEEPATRGSPGDVSPRRE